MIKLLKPIHVISYFGPTCRTFLADRVTGARFSGACMCPICGQWIDWD